MNNWKNLVFSGIAILKNRSTKHAKMAERIVKRVLEQQKSDVDVGTGATTSKALLNRECTGKGLK